MSNYDLTPFEKAELMMQSDSVPEGHAVGIMLKMIMQHDWYYEYSDDHSVYTKGREQAKIMNRFFERLDNHNSDYKSLRTSLYAVLFSRESINLSK